MKLKNNGRVVASYSLKVLSILFALFLLGETIIFCLHGDIVSVSDLLLVMVLPSVLLLAVYLIPHSLICKSKYFLMGYVFITLLPIIYIIGINIVSSTFDLIPSGIVLLAAPISAVLHFYDQKKQRLDS